MSVATIDQVATSLQRPAPDAGTIEALAWQMWLDDAELQIKIRYPDLSLLDQAVLAYVERLAVELKIKNPDPVSTRQTSVDDASESSTWTRSSGTVEILPEWWDMLGGQKKRGKAFAVDTLGSYVGYHLPWCDLNMGGSTCSCGVDIAGVPIYELP